MIKAAGQTGDGRPLVILGFSQENQERLLGNQPIVVKLADLDARLPDMDIIILGGETEASIFEDLRAIGLAP